MAKKLDSISNGDFIDWWRNETAAGNIPRFPFISNEKNEFGKKNMGKVPIHPTEQNWYVNKHIAYQEDWDLTHEMIDDYYGFDPVPSGWKFSPESNGVPGGWIPEVESTVTKALVKSEEKIAAKSYLSRTIRKNWKLGALGLGVIGLTGWMFSGKDDEYNDIEGLLHGGAAQQLRIKNTPFGSGWDPLRNLIGKDLVDSFIRSSSFKNSLWKATPIKTLGEGSFGLAELMSTTIKVGEKEHPFQFVRKTIGHGQEDLINKEIDAYKLLGHLNAPTFYGKEGFNQILMEHIPGEMAHDIMLSGRKLSSESINDLSSFIDKAHEMGLAHGDMTRDVALHNAPRWRTEGYAGEVVPHNVIITPEGRAGVIDWGEWSNPNNKNSDVTRATKQYMGKEISSGELDNALIDGLRKQKGSISRTHQSIGFAPTEVKQISNAIITDNTKSKTQKLVMAQKQKITNINLFENARSAGKRSRSIFATTRR